MGIPAQIDVSGAVTSTPQPSTPGAASLRNTLDITVRQGYGADKGARISVDATDVAPLVIPFETMAKVFFLAIRARGSINLFLTSTSGGVDQRISNVELIVLHIPNDPDALTAIKLSGKGDVEYLIAGN